MTIIRDPQYLDQLDITLDYIAKDSLENALSLLDRIDYQISILDEMPLKFRKSFHFDDERIRDLIINGYTIPYFADYDNDKIVILDIFKWVDR
ncbi:MAG: type II toxin-antitoxin system RelE/ParE family toxin [Epsilonproteobacteria bacterium]|nr:MAG: type II toxin-antitoxin system RelE/ParE family toxin [Campylobacterota bacterium]